MVRIPKVILLIESSRASGRALLRGVADYSRHQGPWSFYWEPNGLEKVRPILKAGDADGILFRDTKATNQILAYGLPSVVVGHRDLEIPGMANVVTDSNGIGRMGAAHLLSRGYRRFAFCGYATTPLERVLWSDIRRESFSERIVAAGFEPPPHYELSMDTDDWQKQRRSLAGWLKALPKPIGLMACNDDCGRLVMEACQVVGLAVPDQVGVVGVDNDEVVCGLTDPPMSSIEINFERAGYDAANALGRLMNGSKGVLARISASAIRIVARRSTDYIDVSAPDLANALRYIRDHACSGVSSSQVSATVGLSRSALDRKFRKMLGRSVVQEIVRVRTEQIGRLLNESSLPVAEIAETFGFADAQEFLKSLQTGRRGRGGNSSNGLNGHSDKDLEDCLPPWVPGVPF